VLPSSFSVLIAGVSGSRDRKRAVARFVRREAARELSRQSGTAAAELRPARSGFSHPYESTGGRGE
jgi:hypothetical protein